MLKILLSSMIILFSSFATFASAPSMRKCMLLPIIGAQGDQFAYKVFERMELFLKDSSWCYYKSNSNIIDILHSYKHNLALHLENPDVLKTIAERTDSGSLLKTKVFQTGDSLRIDFAVIGANGVDVYFKESTILPKSDVDLVNQTLMNWLEIYEKAIPYDGIIIGVLGEQFTLDIGKLSGVRLGTEVKIKRPLRKRRHPLLNEIVNWEMEDIATAKIFNTNNNQSQGKVIQYLSSKKINVGDWIVFEKPKMVNAIDDSKYPEHSKYSFGKLGEAQILFGIGSASQTIVGQQTTKKYGGTLFAAEFRGELWATRNILIKVGLGRGISDLSLEEGTSSVNTLSLTTTQYYIKAGYRFLPLGFFYGPRIDFLLGMAGQSLDLDNYTNEGIVSHSFKGFLMGTHASIPLYKLFRIYLSMDFMLRSQYSESAYLYGEDGTSTNFMFEFGTNYTFNTSMTLDLGFGINSHNAKFDSLSSELKYKDYQFKAGTTFQF